MLRKPRTTALLGAICLLTAGAFLLAGLLPSRRATAQETVPEPPPPPVTLIFHTGTQAANITFFRAARSRDTQVMLQVAPNESGLSQPAEILQGSCPAGGTVAYTLSEVTDSQSQTTLTGVSRRTLFDGTHAVAVHASDSDASITACVNIPARHDEEGGGPHRNQPRPTPTPSGA
jgi:hypothetical protein